MTGAMKSAPHGGKEKPAFTGKESGPGKIPRYRPPPFSSDGAQPKTRANLPEFSRKY